MPESVPERPTPPDDTARHEPTPNATCHAERHDGDSGTTHVCRWLAGHDSAAHNCICGHSWEDSFEDRVLAGFAPAFARTLHSQPPDDAEGLCERAADGMELANLRIQIFGAVVGDPETAQAVWAVVSPVLERRQAEIERLTDFGVQSRERHRAAIADWETSARHHRERADAAEAERDALKAAIAEAVGCWPDLNALRKLRAIAALDTPSAPESPREDGVDDEPYIVDESAMVSGGKRLGKPRLLNPNPSWPTRKPGECTTAIYEDPESPGGDR